MHAHKSLNIQHSAPSPPPSFIREKAAWRVNRFVSCLLAPNPSPRKGLLPNHPALQKRGERL